MEIYRTILVGHDLTRHGQEAATTAAELARTYDAELHICHVIAHFPEDLPVNIIPREDQDPQTALTEKARNQLKQLSEQLNWRRTQLHVWTSRRSAKTELLAQAERLHADLLVVAGGPEAGRLGTTAAGLVHASKCDVLIVRSSQA